MLHEDFRIGIGHDTHRLGPGGPLRLGGIEIPFELHAIGHSDADVLLHAITDALLGAAALGDIGELFPDTDPAYQGADSGNLLQRAWERVRETGFRLINLDCIVFAERPKLKEFKPLMVRRIAELLDVRTQLVNVKAKTAEGLDAVGNLQAIQAQCVVLLASGKRAI